MATQETGGVKPAVVKPVAGKGSLDGLAQRLGALEESLTVVAGELGVSSVPKFKRLDPDSVYKEAIRRAQEAVEPLRLALRNLDGRFDEIARAQAQVKREIAADRDKHPWAESIVAIDAQVAALSARLDATVMPIDQNESKLGALNAAIEKLSLRLDAVWERLDSQARAEQDRKPVEHSDAAAMQRLAALEHRVERLANAASAGPQSSATPQIDPTLIAAEVARQIQTLAKETTGQADPLPLMADSPIDRSRDLNPLVMGATERAIVRLTHRLEKLEEWHRRASGEARSKVGLMGRLFES